jgi:hypothetical protein
MSKCQAFAPVGIHLLGAGELPLCESEHISVYALIYVNALNDASNAEN